jgi:GNAT superfamily N-acetyltransferase
MSRLARVVVRDAILGDSDRVLNVVRQSITRLCVDDHQNDPATLEHWLANKTPEHFARWLADPDRALVVAELDGQVRGAGNVSRAGQIHLCYVEPGFERAGVGAAILSELERRARAWGLTELSLQSSANARGFYARHGYQASAAPACAFGVLKCYPFKKLLASDR